MCPRRCHNEDASVTGCYHVDWYVVAGIWTKALYCVFRAQQLKRALLTANMKAVCSSETHVTTNQHGVTS